MRFALGIEDRIVGRLDPNLQPMPANAQIPPGVEFSSPQLEPEIAVVGAADISRIAEHRVVLPGHLVQPIAHRVQEVTVGRQDPTVQVEFDYRLGALDGVHLALVFRIGKLRGRNIGGELHDLERLAFRVVDRIVGRLDPHRAAILAEALEFAGIESARTQSLPKLLVGVRSHIVGIAEQGVVLSDHLIQPVAHRVEEILVGHQDLAVQVELDHRLGPSDGVHLALVFRVDQLGAGYVGGELHDLERLAVGVEDRVVGRLDPDLPPIFAHALEFAGTEFPGSQRLPEVSIGGGTNVIRIAE